VSGRLYFSLLTREYEGAPWGPQFGDYQRSYVQAELEDYRRQDYAAKDLMIITTGDSARDIAMKVAELNGVCIGCDHAPLPGHRVCRTCGEEGLR
jgi:hypothetical protein